MGDFNADCSYVSSKDWTKIVLREDDSLWWVVDDNEDTTVSVNTDCAYDRYTTSLFTSAIISDAGSNV